MSMNRFPQQKRHISALVAATLISTSFAAHGQERADVEQLRSTALGLIEALVDSGVLSRQRANKLIQDAEAKAKAKQAELPGPEFKVRSAIVAPTAAPAAPAAIMPVATALPQTAEQAQLQAQLKLQAEQIAQLQAQLQTLLQGQGKATEQAQAIPKVAPVPTTVVEAPPVPELGKDGKKIVRVPYVPEAVKREMRDQIKQEVLAQSKTERWGQPDALPEWMGRFSFEGDVRVRYERTMLSPTNSSPGANPVNGFTDGFYTRAADIAGQIGPGGSPTPSFNTQNDRDRWRVRSRIGINAKVSDMVTSGITLSTGNTTERTSTNQTLGQSFNKYSVVVDRAFIKVDPSAETSFSVGRIANPFFSTDLVWADDLNFEGIAISAKPKLSPALSTFLTAGWFPLRESNPGRSSGRDLIGVQGGFDWKLMPKTQFKLGASLYQYHNIEGRSESDATFASDSEYGTRYEYADGFRQRGNTLFLINATVNPASDSSFRWGLASKFKELNLTGSLDLAQFDPMHITLVGDYVKNIGFDRDEIASRTGIPFEDGKNVGYMGKLQVGHPKIKARGDWNVSLAYRYLGSDAVLDAFTNSDFGLGGTNNKGTILGFNYGIDKNAWLALRWLSSDLIDPMAPKRAGTNPETKLSVDLFQIDLNARF